MFKNYSSYRENIKSGDLLLWHTDKVESIVDLLLLIYQKIFKTKFSHVGVAIVMGGRVLVLEANTPQVRLLPVSNTRDFYHLPLNIRWLRRYEEFLYKELGKKYSIIDFMSFLFLTKNDPEKWYCTELGSYFYSNIGLLENDKSGKAPKEFTDKMCKVAAERNNLVEASMEPIFVKLDKAN